MRRNFTITLRELSRTFAQAFNAYRPELHYMRGPGPKCRAKRSGPPAKTYSGVHSARPARLRA
jgi:hypothetical protein